MNTNQIQYNQTAKTLIDFHASNKPVKCVVGPFGSGKSVAMVAELAKLASKVPKDKYGMRKSRFAIIRNTYRELKTTTLKTFKEWIPPNVAKYVYNSPITATLEIDDIQSEFMFFPFDSPTDVKSLLSLELTGAWINEARELPEEVLDVIGRFGRYPKKSDYDMLGKKELDEFVYTLILDSNPPDDDPSNWFYNKFEVKKPEEWDYFKQPPALLKVDDDEGETTYVPNVGQDPLVAPAENVEHHSKGYKYWIDMIPGKSDEWINVHVCGKYGTTKTGKPVYPEYREEKHTSGKDLSILQGVPIVLGWDFGRTPACVVSQITPRGQLRVLKEYVSEDMSVDRFSDIVLQEFQYHFKNFEFYSFGDPAGEHRSEADDNSAMNVLNRKGIRTAPASNTNHIEARIEAVKKYLNKMVDGEPGMIIDPGCEMIRRGLRGQYFFERVNILGGLKFKDKPCKNMYSHILNALEYLCQGATPDISLPVRTYSSNSHLRESTSFMGY